MSQPNIKKIGIIDVSFGEDVTVVEPCNLYGCSIGNNSFIGPFVEIQKNSKIGANCKVQSHAFICEMVTIGDNCFISHGVMFINDVFTIGGPAQGKKELWKPTIIKNNVSIGTNSTILPVTIMENIVVGAGSVVTKDLLEPGIYAGNPAKLIRRF
jgi:acetyltransferase-like isoleucine patch superfamily enzyme